MLTANVSGNNVVLFGVYCPRLSAIARFKKKAVQGNEDVTGCVALLKDLVKVNYMLAISKC